MNYEYSGGEYYMRGDVPAFGSWNWDDAVPFTQQLHYAPYPQDRDLYLDGDLYNNNNHHHLVSPAVILLPRRRAKVGQEPKKATSKNEARELDAATSCPTPVEKRRMAAPKPVDEDLYKVSPHILSVKSTKKRRGGFGCISRCFLPTRVL